MSHDHNWANALSPPHSPTGIVFQHQEVIEEISSAEEEKESFTLNEIREMCKMWETVQKFVDKHHQLRVYSASNEFVKQKFSVVFPQNPQKEA